MVTLSERTIQDLPDKILIEIFSLLDRNTFLVIAMVCKRWNLVIQNNMEFFENFFADDFEEQEEDHDGKQEVDEVYQMKKISTNQGNKKTNFVASLVCRGSIFWKHTIEITSYHHS